MLVWTEQEWRERLRGSILRMVRRMGLLFLIGYLLVLALLALMWIGDPIMQPAVIMLAILLGVLILVMWMVVSMMTLRAVETGPVVGLYEKGIQLNQLIFVPYEEIGSFEVDRGGFGPARQLMVILRMRYKPRGMGWLTTPRLFFIQHSYLGEAGVEELDRRIGGLVPDQHPPKLVLYGPRTRR